MDKKETEDFILIWNTKNGFKNGICAEENMRYVSDGIVTWNEYNAPYLNIIQVVEIYNSIIKK